MTGAAAEARRDEFARAHEVDALTRTIEALSRSVDASAKDIAKTIATVDSLASSVEATNRAMKEGLAEIRAKQNKDPNWIGFIGLAFTGFATLGAVILLYTRPIEQTTARLEKQHTESVQREVSDSFREGFEAGSVKSRLDQAEAEIRRLRGDG